MGCNRFPVLVHSRLGSLAVATLLAACIVSLEMRAQEAADEGKLRLSEVRIDGEGVFEATLELSRLPSRLSGLQFDLVAEQRGLRVDASLSPQASREGKRLYLRQIEPGVFRFLIVGFNQEQMQAGPLATLSLQGAQLSLTGARPFTIQRALGTDDSGKRVELAVAQDLPERDDEQRGDRVRQP